MEWGALPLVVSFSGDGVENSIRHDDATDYGQFVGRSAFSRCLMADIWNVVCLILQLCFKFWRCVLLLALLFIFRE